MNSVIKTAKDIIRSVLNALHLDLTKNLEYDRLTKKIMKRVIGPSSNCVDVGCHTGEILSCICHLAPRGRHFAFEPIPVLFDNLDRKFGKKVKVFPYALSHQEGTSVFHFVKNAPAFSGLQPRRYDNIKPEIENIDVQLRRLDQVIPTDTAIDFIKIDVEGGEFNVLKGATDILKKHRPVVIFESGLGSGLHYGTKPEEMFQLLADAGLKVSTLRAFIGKQPPLTSEQFSEYYHNEKEYYFIAFPREGCQVSGVRCQSPDGCEVRGMR